LVTRVLLAQLVPRAVMVLQALPVRPVLKGQLELLDQQVPRECQVRLDRQVLLVNPDLLEPLGQREMREPVGNRALQEVQDTRDIQEYLELQDLLVLAEVLVLRGPLVSRVHRGRLVLVDRLALLGELAHLGHWDQLEELEVQVSRAPPVFLAYLAVLEPQD